VKTELEMVAEFDVFLENIEKHTSLLVKKRIYNTILQLVTEKLKILKPEQSSGGNPITATAYKLNGDKVHLLIDNKKIYRSVYVKGKGNGKAKYCKINNEFILLSKLKNII
jgi:hypothetical protein